MTFSVPSPSWRPLLTFTEGIPRGFQGNAGFSGNLAGAANGGVTNGGLRGVWPPFPEIGRNRPFPPFFCLSRPFPEGTKSTWEIQKTEEKGLFPQISSDLLKPPSLKPPFAAFQNLGGGGGFGRFGASKGFCTNSQGTAMALAIFGIAGDITRNLRNKKQIWPFPALTLQPLLFWKKSNKGNPEKNKGFSLRLTPKILGKGRKNAQKKTKSEKKQGNKKKQGLEGQGVPL